MDTTIRHPARLVKRRFFSQPAGIKNALWRPIRYLRFRIAHFAPAVRKREFCKRKIGKTNSRYPSCRARGTAELVVVFHAFFYNKSKKTEEGTIVGFLKRLLGIGVTAGATVAAVKVAEQVKENNPDGIQDVNGDGKVDVRDVVSEVAKAATEVYHDAVDAVTGAAATVKEKAPEYAGKVKDAVTDTVETVKEKAPEYAGKVKDAVTGAVETVKEKTPEYAGKVKDAATGAAEALKETVPTVFERVKDAVAEPFEKPKPVENAEPAANAEPTEKKE